MDNAIAQLRLALGDLLQYYPLVLRNDLYLSSAATATPLHDSPSSSPPADGPSLPLAEAAAPSHDRRQMAEAVEGFLTELTHALSLGLHDGDGFELWSVLELLECVPDRMQAEAQAAERLSSSPSPSLSASRSRQPPSGPALSPPTSRTPVKTAGVSSSRAAAANTALPPVAATTPTMRSDAPLWHHQLQRFRFASQLVYVVRTGFPAAPRPLQARILLRLALNQGCLLASLELLRRWCRTELEGFYDVTECAGALLVQPSSDSDTWHSFVAAIAPVAGPPMSEIAAGAPKTAAQSFQLQLVVAGLDDDPYASLDYYTQLHSYLKGRRGTRPSALACVEAAQLRRAREEGERAAATAAVAMQRRSRAAPSVSSTAHGAQAGAEGEAVAVKATRRHTNTARVGAVVRQHAVLEVESLPITHASAQSSTRADRGDQPDGGGEATASQSSKSTQRQRHRRRRRKPRRGPRKEQEEREHEEGEEEGEMTGRSSAPSQRHRGAVGSGQNSSSSSSSLSSSFSLASAVASAFRADSPGGQSGVPAAPSPQGSCEETPLVEKKTKKEATEGVREAEESLRQPHQGSGGHEGSSTASPAVLYDGRMHVSAERGVDRASDGDTESRAQELASPPRRSEANCTADANVTHADVALTAGPLEFAPSVSITDPEAKTALSAESSSPPPVLRTLARSTQQHVPPPLPQYDRGNGDDDRDGDGACHVMQYSKEAGAVEKKEAGDVAGSPSSLPCTPAELAQLQSRVLQCWTVAVAHAEARERKGMAARDADANCLDAVM